MKAKKILEKGVTFGAEPVAMLKSAQKRLKNGDVVLSEELALLRQSAAECEDKENTMDIKIEWPSQTHENLLPSNLEKT